MRGLMKLPVILIISGLFVGCASPTPAPAPTAAATPVTIEEARHAKNLQDAGLKYHWNCNELPKLLEPGETIAKAYLLDENLYCLTTTNRMIAIDAATGTVNWERWAYIADPGVQVFDPSHANNLIIPRTPPTRKEILQPERSYTGKIRGFDAVVINTKIMGFVYDRKTGQEIRRIPFKFPSAASTAVCSDGRLMFVPDVRGWYHAFKLHEALISWTMAIDGAIDGAILAPAKYIDDKVIVASSDGVVEVSSTFQSRKKVWTRKLEAGVEAPFAVTRNHLMIPCMDRSLYAFDPTTGQRLWTPYDCKKQLRDAPQISEISVFQYARGGKFYALNLVSGKLRWTLPDARKILAAMNQNVYVQDTRNRVLVVDEVLGEIKASIQLPSTDMLLGNTSAPAIYGVGRDGRAYCIRDLKAKHITAKMLRDKSKK